MVAFHYYGLWNTTWYNQLQPILFHGRLHTKRWVNGTLNNFIIETTKIFSLNHKLPVDEKSTSLWVQNRSDPS